MDLVEALGLIKYISQKKKIASGKIRVLHPMGLRGLEVDFLLSNVKMDQADRCLLESGMTLRFMIKGDSENGFTAHELTLVECAAYNGSVIKVPSPSDPTSRTLVSLDLTLNTVVVSNHSLKSLNLRPPLACGDYVKLIIRSSNWMKAQHNRTRPEFDIVEVLEKSKLRPRALSQGRDENRVENGSSRQLRFNDEVSSEELSPQHERVTRQRESSQRGQRRRSRSVGCGSPFEDEMMPLEYYPYAPPQRFPYQYPMMTPDMMYGSFANFYNQSSVWMAPNFMPPFMPRGAR